MSGLIPENFINELLSRVDIVELVGAKLPLRKSGKNLVTNCPFHQEKTPSFMVNRGDQFYHCFGCGVSGDAIQFTMEYEKLAFVEAVDVLAAKVGMQLPTPGHLSPVEDNKQPLYKILQQAQHYYQQQLKISKQAIEYLKFRGITGQTAKIYALGYAVNSWNGVLDALQLPAEKLLASGLLAKSDKGHYYDRFRDRIIFPIRDSRGRVIGFGGRVIAASNDGNFGAKYLNSPETLVFHKGHELYGLYEAKQANKSLSNIIVVEGYFDVVVMANFGVTNVVATLGTAVTVEHIQALFKVTAEIIFCFDADRAGKDCAWRALKICLPLMQAGRCIKFLFLPDGEDPDSFINANGKDAWQHKLERASSFDDYLFSKLSKEINLNQLDNRARFAMLVEPFIAQVPAPVLRQLLYKRLATIVGLDLQSNKSQVKSVVRSRPRYQEPASKPVVPAIRALALLLQQRDLLELIDLEKFHDAEDLDIELLHFVTKTLQQDVKTTTEQIFALLPTKYTG